MYTATSLEVVVARTLTAFELTSLSRSSSTRGHSDAVVRMATSSDVVVVRIYDLAGPLSLLWDSGLGTLHAWQSSILFVH